MPDWRKVTRIYLFVVAAALIGLVFLGHVGVALVFLVIVVGAVLVVFGFVTPPAGIAFTVGALPWVGIASLVALFITMRVSS